MIGQRLFCDWLPAVFDNREDKQPQVYGVLTQVPDSVRLSEIAVADIYWALAMCRAKS